MGGIFARRGIRSHRSGPKFVELSGGLDRLSLFVPCQLFQDGLGAASRMSRGLPEEDRQFAARLGGDLPCLRQGNFLLKRIPGGPAVRTGVRHRLRVRGEAAHVAFDLRHDIDRIDAGHHGGGLGAGPGDTLQPPELFFLAAAEFFECHLHAHLRDRHVGQVVERQSLNEGAEGPCEGVRFLPTFGGQVPGHPRKCCRPLDTGERISRFGTGAMPMDGRIQMPQPNCFFAVSDIISGVHGGSQTMFTDASLTPWSCSSFRFTSWWMYAEAGHPGAVSVMRTSTLPSSGFSSMLYTRPRS